MENHQNEVKARTFDHPLAGLHIVEDAGNGAAGFLPLKSLNCLAQIIRREAFS